MTDEDRQTTDVEVASVKYDIQRLRDYLEGQFKHGQDHLDRLERDGKDRTARIEALAVRMASIERVKVYAEGFKGGLVWAVISVTSFFGAAALWIVNKLGP